MLYIVDVEDYLIRSFHLVTERVGTLVGTEGSFGHYDGHISVAKLRRPRRITSDGRNLYFTEDAAYTVRQIDLVAGVVSTVAGEVYVRETLDGVGTAARFDQPWGITWDPWRGHLFVAEAIAGGSIRRIE